MERGYHHGTLRQTIIDAALETIAVAGPGSLSLRELARRADVSHAAPAHHFKDKAGLLTAIAADGYARLADALAGSPWASLLDVGASYVRFALTHPAHFEVMFRPDLYHQGDPDLQAARRRTNEALRSAVAAGAGRENPLTELGAWSIAHGFATLWASGALARMAGDHDPVELFRACASLTFNPAGNPPQ